MTQDDKDGDKYGEPRSFDPTFNGPIKNRGCTDIICCILLVLYVIGWAAIGIVSFVHGNPEILLYPTDSQGHICGVDALKSKPFLFFFDLTVCAKLGVGSLLNGCPTPQICVEECPQKNFLYLNIPLSNSVTSRSELICKYSVDPMNVSRSVDNLIESDDCAPYYFESKSYFGRCIPRIVEDALVLTIGSTPVIDKSGGNVSTEAIVDGIGWVSQALNLESIGQKVFQDFIDSWWQIIVALVIAMVISFLWIVMLRWIAGIIIWVSLFALIGLLGFGCFYCYTKYTELQGVQGSNLSLTEVGFTTDVGTYLALRDTWLAFGIIITITLIVILLILIFLRSRLLIAIALLKEGSRAVGHMMLALFFPLVPFVMQIICFTWWAVVAVYLASSVRAQYVVADAQTGASQANWESCDPNTFSIDNALSSANCIFATYGSDFYFQNVAYLQLYNIFGWFWMMSFVIAFGQMALAGAFASYYWAFNKPQDIPTFALTASVWRCFRYHLGTLAFGSLIIAIVKLIRLGLEYLSQKLRGTDNKAAQYCLMCLKCCFWCLEKFLKFINKNAYIMVAIYGKNFCTSAKEAFSLLMRNIVRVVVLDNVTDFLLFLSKLMVVGAVGVVSFYFFSGGLSSYVGDYVPQLNYYFAPVIAIVIGSYVITSGFFNVYSMAVDTLFLCFLEDSERNNGSIECPYYMSKDLMHIVGKSNKVNKPNAW